METGNSSKKIICRSLETYLVKIYKVEFFWCETSDPEYPENGQKTWHTGIKATVTRLGFNLQSSKATRIPS